MKWISIKDELPKEEESYKLFLICHYNSHMEIARYEDGDWFVISPRFSVDDEKCNKEGQPDYWMPLPDRPNE